METNEIICIRKGKKVCRAVFVSTRSAGVVGIDDVFYIIMIAAAVAAAGTAAYSYRDRKSVV